MKHGKQIIRIIIAVLLTVALLYTIQCLVMPKYMSEIPEGAMIAEYYEEEVKDHDVLFISDCELYENISPITLWENYGITSYIRGSAQQLIWQSYYLLEETLKYETPRVFVFNVLAMKYDVPQSEAYNRMSIDGMKFSLSKISNIKASMADDEDFITYLFPLLRYHSRWSELTVEDFRYCFGKKEILTHNGYLMQKGVVPMTYAPTGRPLADYTFSDTCYEYLDKMLKLCRENGIQMVLVKAPSVYPYWYEKWDDQMVAYAEANGLSYYNFLADVEETGIDFLTDTYDNGLHLNVYGAEKLSVYFGKLLSEEYELPDHRSDEYYRDIWKPKVERYYQERD